MFDTIFKCTYPNVRTVGPDLNGILATLVKVIVERLLDDVKVMESILHKGIVPVPDDQLEILFVALVDLLKPVTGLLMEVAP